MKKILLYTAALAGLLAAASCQKEEIGAVSAGNGNVTFAIQTPGDPVTRTIGDGENVNIVHYEIYKAETGHTNSLADGTPLVEGTVPMSGKEATLTLNLLEDQDYVALFWAQVDQKDYYDVTDLRKVEVKYDGVNSNDEARAAFYQRLPFNTTEKVSTTVTLVRPFAQLNIGHTLNGVDLGYTVDIEASKVTVTSPAKFFNVNTANAHTSAGEVTFALAANPDEDLNVNGEIYEYAAMNYFLVEGNSGSVDVVFDIETDKGTVADKVVAQVPVKMNYRTNLLGNLLTKETKIEIVVDERFNLPDLEVDFLSEIPEVVDLGEGKIVILPALSADHTVLVKGYGRLEIEGTEIISAEGPAIELADDADVTLVIKGDVVLTGATAGIYVPETATLKVVGSDYFAVKSSAAANLKVTGNAGSGIDGSVTIDALAHITAKGNGDHAFGIGGNGAAVAILNTTVDYACGGHIQPLCINDPKYGKSEPEGGAAIGGAKVTIENSTITKAEGGSKAAAIGAQYWQSTEIVILGSTLGDIFGGNASAAIGGSRYSGDISETNKQVSRIRIENSTISNAVGGQFGAGIGAGYDTHCAANDSNAVNEIVIVNSDVTAKGGMYAAGIGTGYHSAALTGSIDAASTINAVSGDKFYKDSYTEAQNIGYGVVDFSREAKDLSVTFTVAGQKISAPAASYVENENEVLIGGVNGLKKFAEEVNSGNDYYAGKTVILTSDIDLNDVEWTPVGSATADHGFMGNFDGNGYVIKNLNITNLEPDADGYVYAGLFGVTEGTETQENYIKNLTIENVNIQTEGHIAAAAIAYPYYTTVENITVEGDINIKGGDYTAGVLAYTRRCVNAKNLTISADEDSVIEGNITVGGVISDIQMNGGLKANYSNFSASGLTIKGVKCVGGISGIISQQTLDGATVKNVNIVSDSAKKGIVSGADGGNSTVLNVSYENVNGATCIIGAAYKSIEAATAEELSEALANGADVVLATDFEEFALTTKAPYGNYCGIAQNGGVLDGAGHTLDFAYRSSDGKTDNYGIMTSGGTIKNLKVTGVFRGIMIMDPKEDIIIDNVTIADAEKDVDVCYTINTGEGDGTHSLIINDSKIYGWTSFGTAVKDVTLTGCTFGQGQYYTNVYGRLVKPYVDAVFENCEFCSKFYIDLSQLGKDGDGNVLSPDAKITLKGCTVNGVKLTAQNWTDLVASESDCKDGQISIELKDGSYMSASNVVNYVVFE